MELKVMITGRSYDQNFLRFSPIFAKNWRFFSKNKVMSHFCSIQQCFASKQPTYFWRKYIKNHNIGLCNFVSFQHFGEPCMNISNRKEKIQTFLSYTLKKLFGAKIFERTDFFLRRPKNPGKREERERSGTLVREKRGGEETRSD
jgi:hypothetical protein